MPRGKGLGGSSGMNAMLYVRGRPIDYDLGTCPAGAGTTSARTSSRPRTTRAAPRSTTPPAGRCGSRTSAPRAPLTRRFLAAAEANGIRYIDDYNGPEQDGAALCQVTQRNGKRWSTNDAYLRPVRDRANLTVVTGVNVRRVEIAVGRATGVVCQGPVRGRARDRSRAAR